VRRHTETLLCWRTNGTVVGVHVGKSRAARFVIVFPNFHTRTGPLLAGLGCNTQRGCTTTTRDRWARRKKFGLVSVGFPVKTNERDGATESETYVIASPFVRRPKRCVYTVAAATPVRLRATRAVLRYGECNWADGPRQVHVKQTVRWVCCCIVGRVIYKDFEFDIL